MNPCDKHYIGLCRMPLIPNINRFSRSNHKPPEDRLQSPHILNQDPKAGRCYNCECDFSANLNGNVVVQNQRDNKKIYEIHFSALATGPFVSPPSKAEWHDPGEHILSLTSPLCSSATRTGDLTSSISLVGNERRRG